MPNYPTLHRCLLQSRFFDSEDSFAVPLPVKAIPLTLAYSPATHTPMPAFGVGEPRLP
jgi:hypothetical protein